MGCTESRTAIFLGLCHFAGSSLEPQLAVSSVVHSLGPWGVGMRRQPSRLLPSALPPPHFRARPLLARGHAEKFITLNLHQHYSGSTITTVLISILVFTRIQAGGPRAVTFD